MHNQNDKLTGIPADAEKKKFTGIWIPAEVWDDDNLPPLARVLYGEIASYGKSGCWVKTEELRQPLGVSEKTFQKLCKELKDGGYITEQRRFGRIVRTTTLSFQSSRQKLHQSKNYRDERGKNYRDEQGNDCAVQLEYTKEYTKEHTKGASAPADAIIKLKKRRNMATMMSTTSSKGGAKPLGMTAPNLNESATPPTISSAATRRRDWMQSSKH